MNNNNNIISNNMNNQDFGMNPPLNAYNINRMPPGPNPINFAINMNMNNINSRNRIIDE